MTDARFEDGADLALTLKAETAEDLGVLSALVQDAVLTGTDMAWDRRGRVLSLLVNRFRWEDLTAAERAQRPYERVRSVLTIGDVLTVASQGIDRHDGDLILSILSMDWEQGTDGAGRLVLTLAGDGAIAVAAEWLNVTLADVTRPYLAPSGQAPRHPN